MFFFSSRRRHTRLQGDWSSDVCSSDLWFEIAGLSAPRPLLMLQGMRDSIFPRTSARRAGRATEAQYTTLGHRASARSEERRVGKESRDRWSGNCQIKTRKMEKSGVTWV